MFQHMSFENWTASLEPKVNGSWNLHSLLPKGMDFFILLSSISGIIGSATQVNYATGNTYQDALARHRISNGERAASIDLGVMLDDGILAENAAARTRLTSSGYLMEIRSKELNALLDRYCNPNSSVGSCVKAQVLVGIDTPAAAQAKGVVDVPLWMRRPPFRHFHQMGRASESSSNSTENRISYAELLSGAERLEDAARIVSDAVVAKLSKTMVMSPDSFDLTKPMHTYGVDSLFAVELRNWFKKDLEAEIAVFDIMGNASFEDVGILGARRSRFVSEDLKATK